VTAATRYARADGLHIAYQVQGEGTLDLVFMPHWASHVELLWDEPVNARFLRRLASFSRLIMFDRRGVGLSDPVPDEQIEAATTVEDLGCVLDAIESPRAVLVACDGAGFGAIHFAVQHPERVEALVLLNSTARVLEDVDYQGFAQSEVRGYLESVSEQWVDGAAEIDVADPSMVTNVAYREWLTRYQRAAVRPATAAAIMRGGLRADVRSLLPLVTARTLVIHRADDVYFPAQQGRYLAEHIPDATYIELPGSDHPVMLGDATRILDEVELFLLGRRRSDYERRVATVLFVDIVDSTRRAVAVGDLAWRDTLEAHETATRRYISEYGGREIFTKGDEFLVVFAMPTDAIGCAVAIRDSAVTRELSVRAGIHAGELELRGTDIAGIAVHVGARIEAIAAPGQILVSRTVADLIMGSNVRLTPAGVHTLRGVAGEWELWEA